MYERHHSKLKDLRDGFSHRQELVGVVLSNDGLEHFVSERRQHSIVEVRAQFLVDLGQFVLARPGEDAEVDVDHLEIFGARDRSNFSRARTNIDNHRRLNERNLQRRAFPDRFGQDAANLVHHDRAMSTVDVVQTLSTDERQSGNTGAQPGYAT